MSTPMLLHGDEHGRSGLPFVILSSQGSVWIWEYDLDPLSLLEVIDSIWTACAERRLNSDQASLLSRTAINQFLHLSRTTEALTQDG